MLKFSLILPIYHVEDFLADCMESLFAQDLCEEEYEIICVIDGSTDNSQAIVEQYMGKHSNINLIVQENKGVCSARNKGMKNASGRYVWFIDPDDIIASNCLGKIYSELEKAHADIFEFQYKICEEEYRFTPESVEFQVDGVNREGSAGSACQAIYRRKYLKDNDISFQEELSYGEDYLWAFQTKYRYHVSIYSNAPLYVYRQRKNSAMHTSNRMKTEKHMNDMIELHKLYGKEWQRCKADNMGETVLQDIGRRQQLCIEAALLCLMKLKLSRAEVKKKLNEFENMGCYPYRFMTWNMIGKGTVHPLKNRVVTFLFPIKGYYLLLCGLYRFIQR